MARDEVQRLRSRIQELEAQLADRTRELQEALLKLEQQATADDVTGVANQRHFLANLAQHLQQAARTRRPFALLLIELQGNDRGDAVLKNIAYILRDNARAIDTLGRIHDNEFALALPETDLQGARAVAERLRRGVEPFHVEPRSSEPQDAASDPDNHALSLAIGGCVLNDEDRAPPRDHVAPEAFMEAATRALEAAQRGADDQVVCVRYGRSPLDMS